MKNLILIGAGGHCTSCIDVIEHEGKYRLGGILDKKENVGKEVLGYKIIGTDADVLEYVKDNYFLCTLGMLGKASLRNSIIHRFIECGAKFATVVSPKAHLSNHSALSFGTIVMHQATVNANVIIGSHCIINTGANIEHDCIIEDFTHISTNAVINGNCHIAQSCFVGSNATLIQGITLQEKSIVGAGAVVLQSFARNGVFLGNPAKKRKI